MNTLFGREDESSEEEILSQLITTGILSSFDGGETCGERKGLGTGDHARNIRIVKKNPENMRINYWNGRA